jgi:phosphinothricin acetyltransferase
MRLRGKQLKLRHAETDDLEALTGIYNHYVRETTATFDVQPFQPEARRTWLSHYAIGTPHQLWVAERNHAVLGYASSSQFRQKQAYDMSVETSVYLHPDPLGKGLGQALYARLFEGLERFETHRAYAGIALPNAASVALHLSFGFALCGTFAEVGYKFGGYHDVAWYEKLL